MVVTVAMVFNRGDPVRLRATSKEKIEEEMATTTGPQVVVILASHPTCHAGGLQRCKHRPDMRSDPTPHPAPWIAWPCAGGTYSLHF